VGTRFTFLVFFRTAVVAPEETAAVEVAPQLEKDWKQVSVFFSFFFFTVSCEPGPIVSS